jgi:peroxiredoxin
MKNLLWIKVIIAGGLLIFSAALAGLFLVGRADSPPADRSAAGPAVIGEPLRNFQVEDLQGSPVQLADYAGRMVLVNFWATWCPPCQREMPDLNAFYLKHRGSGFVVLAVNTGETREQAAGFAEEAGLQFPILLDPQQALSDSLAIHDFPTSILVGPDGTVKVVHIGLFSAQALESEIGVFLAQD